MFKKISIAYAVLSDPNKRRQYDVSGPSSALTDFEGLDISELGGVGRIGHVFNQFFSRSFLWCNVHEAGCAYTHPNRPESPSPGQRLV